jgi:hypothetical protein
MALTFPITSDGLIVDVLVNHEAAVLVQLWQQGIQPQPAPARAIIDTGSDISAVSLPILQQLGAQPVLQAMTQGIGGAVSVRLYKVSLHIFDTQNVNLPWLPHPTLLVMELAPDIPFDVLIGLDIIRTCKMTVDGPGGFFTLE